MDQEKVTLYLKKLEEDTGMQQKMIAARSPEECLEIVKEYGFDFELDEFRNLMQSLIVPIQKKLGQELTDEELAKLASQELTAEELAMVSGGDALDNLQQLAAMFLI